MVANSTRRLPGFRFEASTPPLTDVLPRMDIAAFVGFAASGPLHRPVAVEDAAEFEDIFGADLPLAWDQLRGEWQYAHLAPSVRAFFQNGGRRCWVVRVAREGEAASNSFPLPGLVGISAAGSIAPAFAAARSEGSWSDPVRVSTALNVDPVDLSVISWSGLTFNLNVGSAIGVGPGDLLRATFPGTDLVVFLPIAAVATDGSTAGSRLRIKVSQAIWFRTTPPVVISARASGSAQSFDARGRAASFTVLGAPQTADARSIAIDLALSSVEEVPVGSVLQVDFAGARLWLTVKQTSAGQTDGSPPGDVVHVVGEGLWTIPGGPSVFPSVNATAERLTFDLWARSSVVLRLNDLGFVSGHPFFWGDLPQDRDLFRDEWRSAPAEQITDLWTLAAKPRFPLAGEESGTSLFVPIGMQALPDQAIGPVPTTVAALQRDGLAKFDPTLFLDPKLRDTGLLDLMNEADFVRYNGPVPRALKGIHAALSVDEVTIVAAPDCVHAGWHPFQPDRQEPPLPSASLLRPEWWHFLPCGSTSQIPAVREPQWGEFLRCAIHVVNPPALHRNDVDPTGTFTLSWTGRTGQAYVLEEATTRDFADAAPIYTGAENTITLYGKTRGDYYYRVRAIEGVDSSDWSNGVGIRIAPSSGFAINDSYSPSTLLEVQRALLRMSAARGDLFAVLDLPESYREDESIAHIAALKTAGIFGFGEQPVFSYGAVYHPWLIGRDEQLPSLFRRTPPSGSACGILAKRTLERGAWIAAANEVMTGIVDLTPRIARERWIDIQQAQINLVRQEARGFLALSADTLSEDEDLRPINVRRLLSLLRRVALRLGANYVFEPDDDSFRRLVEGGFDAMLRDMFRRGAFAGPTAAASYQVVTSTSVNTPQSVEQGRFIVELRVAPALPLTFLTVRLLQSGDQKLFVEAR